MGDRQGGEGVDRYLSHALLISVGVNECKRYMNRLITDTYKGICTAEHSGSSIPCSVHTLSRNKSKFGRLIST